LGRRIKMKMNVSDLKVPLRLSDLSGPDDLDRTTRIKPERELTGEVRVLARNLARAVRW
jgi:hypothetical protein